MLGNPSVGWALPAEGRPQLEIFFFFIFYCIKVYEGSKPSHTLFLISELIKMVFSNFLPGTFLKPILIVLIPNLLAIWQLSRSL